MTTITELLNDLRRRTRKGASFWDPAVRDLRARIAAMLKDALLDHCSIAQAEEAESDLWKVVFYQPIEAFRQRILRASNAGESGEEALRKATAAFNSFLAEAITFYEDLVLDVQAIHGTGDCAVVFEAQGEPNIEHSTAKGKGLTADSASVVPTVARCLICLGDLARYQAASVQDVSKRNWRPAAQYYRAAASIQPAIGNAFSQLAVLSMYNDCQLGAVVYNMRALAATIPFPIARNNLLLLLEQGRVRYQELLPKVATRPGGSRTLLVTRHKDKLLLARSGPPAQATLQKQHQQPPSVEEVAVRYVRLIGILFTRIDVDTIPAVAAGAAAACRAMTTASAQLRALTATPRGGSLIDSPAVLLAVGLIAIADHCAIPPGTRQRLSVSEDLQRQHLLDSAQSAVIQLAVIFSNAVCDSSRQHTGMTAKIGGNDCGKDPKSGSLKVKGKAHGKGTGRNAAPKGKDDTLKGSAVSSSANGIVEAAFGKIAPDMGRCLLPAIHVLLLWLSATGKQRMFGNGASGGASSEEIGTLQLAATQLQGWTSGQPMRGTPSSDKLRLPELIQLRGFRSLPLICDTDGGPPVPLPPKEEHAVRVASLVSSLQTLLARLRARDQQQRQQPPPNNASAPVTRPPPLASGNTPSVVQSTAARSEDGVDDDGDDEEVIVFAPRQNTPCLSEPDSSNGSCEPPPSGQLPSQGGSPERPQLQGGTKQGSFQGGASHNKPPAVPHPATAMPAHMSQSQTRRPQLDAITAAPDAPCPPGSTEGQRMLGAHLPMRFTWAEDEQAPSVDIVEGNFKQPSRTTTPDFSTSGWAALTVPARVSSIWGAPVDSNSQSAVLGIPARPQRQQTGRQLAVISTTGSASAQSVRPSDIRGERGSRLGNSPALGDTQQHQGCAVMSTPVHQHTGDPTSAPPKGTSLPPAQLPPTVRDWSWLH